MIKIKSSVNKNVDDCHLIAVGIVTQGGSDDLADLVKKRIQLGRADITSPLKLPEELKRCNSQIPEESDVSNCHADAESKIFSMNDLDIIEELCMNDSIATEKERLLLNGIMRFIEDKEYGTRAQIANVYRIIKKYVNYVRSDGYVSYVRIPTEQEESDGSDGSTQRKDE